MAEPVTFVVPASGVYVRLTGGQVEVMRLLAAGMLYQDIADALCLSLAAVRKRAETARCAVGAVNAREALVILAAVGVVGCGDG